MEELHVHPRLRFQGLDRKERITALGQAVPDLVAFRGRRAHGLIALLDWDHRLPSTEVLLRVHLCYEPRTLTQAQRALDARHRRILALDRFPEFDVPDYVGLPGDEQYECTLRPDLSIVSWRLLSAWRRDVVATDAQRAIGAVQRCEQLERLRPQYPSRGTGPEDLEAVSWVPPCESGHPRWTLDIWWLTEVEGTLGKGWSFLVELPQPPVGAEVSTLPPRPGVDAAQVGAAGSSGAAGAPGSGGASGAATAPPSVPPSAASASTTPGSTPAGGVPTTTMSGVSTSVRAAVPVVVGQRPFSLRLS